MGVEFTFTGLGSLIHPFAMIVLVVLWVVTAYFGYVVRKSRVSPPQGEESSLLHRNVRSVAEGKKWHHKLSSALLCVTYFVMLVGMFNTYLRSGKLFPSAHMYGGFWFIFFATVQAALVPWLGAAIAVRNVHVCVGVIVVIILLNQVWSGIPILQGVWSTVFS